MTIAERIKFYHERSARLRLMADEWRVVGSPSGSVFEQSAATWALAAATLEAAPGPALPGQTPNPYPWSTNAQGLIDMIGRKPNLWHVDADLKYVTMVIDTRDGHFLLYDRSGKPLLVARLVEAADKAR